MSDTTSNDQKNGNTQSQEQQYTQTTSSEIKKQVNERVDSVTSEAASATLSLVGNVYGTSVDSIKQVGGEVKSAIKEAKDLIKKYDIEEKTEEQAKKELDKIVKKIREISDKVKNALDSLKQSPGQLKSIASDSLNGFGLFKKLGESIMSTPILSSSELLATIVSIEPNDLGWDVWNYPNITKQFNKIKETTGKLKDGFFEDAKKSADFKAIEWKPNWTTNITEFKFFETPGGTTEVADLAEEVISKTVKPMWQDMIEMIKPLADFVPIDSIRNSLNFGIEMIDTIGTIATTSVPEKELDKYLAKLEQGKSDIQQAIDRDSKIVQQNAASQKQINNIQKLKTDIKKKQNELKEEGKGLFESSPNPEDPPWLKEMFTGLWEGFGMLSKKLSNIFLFIIMKVISLIIEILKKIMEMLGLGELPGLLGSFMKLAEHAWDMICFAMELPESLMELVKAIVRKKIKMMKLAYNAIPPKPIEDNMIEDCSPEVAEELEKEKFSETLVKQSYNKRDKMNSYFQKSFSS